uniref:MADF domain-containing protein n=1 Tax=Timema poppense TaxID=170557 RepID=A0A7R9DLT9_TIMPO|nr:unnamed protein product [Timema poppensis]
MKSVIIWDKRLKGHATRNVVDKTWKEIAAEMGVEDGKVLRKKWKYLRDQFTIEMGKFPPCRSGDPNGHPESKWPYFKSLMFLVGVVKPRTTLNNSKSSKIRAHQDNENFDMVAHTADSGIELTDCVQEVQTQASDPQNTYQETQLDETVGLSGKGN